MPGGLTPGEQEDIEMRSERRAERHRPHVVGDAAHPRAVAGAHAGLHAEPESRFSLLRLSVPARLTLVAVAAAVLWGAVLWALA
jgi:hypothetical protein